MRMSMNHSLHKLLTKRKYTQNYNYVFSLFYNLENPALPYLHLRVQFVNFAGL